ncbi:MAG: hypothetical protein EOP47_28275 [Sphingobacteriaceae bacterium]|nr:MAG: hypothetical protein EOP47_28275 [Sphingobacteriaceae bacterium]
MSAKLQTIRLLNGIALLNKERAAGYKKLVSLLNSSNAQQGCANLNLEILMHNFVRDSTVFSNTLENIVLIEGGKMPYGTRVDQQLYRKATAMRELFAEADNLSILTVCDACEALIHGGYSSVIEAGQLHDDPKNMLVKQQVELQKAKELVQQLKIQLDNVNEQASIIPIGRAEATELQLKVVG